MTLASALALSLASPALAQDGTFPPGGGPGGGAPRGPDGQRGLDGQQGPGGQRPAGQRGGDPAQMVDRVMQADANGDGKLSKEEMPPMLVERIWERADTNKDGFVDRVELEVVAKEGGMRGGQGGQAGQGSQGGRGNAGGAAMNFEGAMKQANGAYKALRASALDAASLKTDLEAVQRLQMGLVGSKGTIASVPVSDAAKAKYGEDKAAYEKAFRKSLLASIMVSFEIEQAILDGDSAAAKAGLTKLHDTEESGHSLFQEGDEANNEKEGGKSAAPRARGSRGQNAPATKD